MEEWKKKKEKWDAVNKNKAAYTWENKKIKLEYLGNWSLRKNNNIMAINKFN